MNKIYKHVIADIIRNRIVLFYTFILLLASLSVFSLEDTSSKGLLSMLNIILMIVPLVCLIFSTIYMYNSSEFIELLLSQPLRRNTIWWSLFIGLITALGLAFFVGAGIVILIFEPSFLGLMLVICGILLTFIFTAIALLAAVLTKDKAKGIGLSIILWLFYAIIFDGIVLFMLFQWADYPIEKFMILISMLNPIDLARILILMQMDVSALMGYTGAIFKDFFGTSVGIALSFGTLILWVIIPFICSLRYFKKKDL
ncbi:ABC transporter permease subunit [Aquirufa aurantiipilula]|uniref:ABC transporter permease subunit n=1 Tax=Aquirufa aurantiipilula TaxID=2696561 RepID=A0ABT6BKM2_9BACT|nr:ABC transporter permease subunit [Aquirufa aurantiipilula]MBZ1327618.1 ABC transporter permease subunit [Aquirufa aurantiipilula]MDF5691025.1 ABC transporter permease subunit [Aquirufa aurantiipilula]